MQLLVSVLSSKCTDVRFGLVHHIQIAGMQLLDQYIIFKLSAISESMCYFPNVDWVSVLSLNFGDGITGSM